jgi:deoxycytidylate deaminase
MVSMSKTILHTLFAISIATFFLFTIPVQSYAANKGEPKVEQPSKERLVLMPIRVPEDDKNLTGAMETALVKGLQKKYDVFSGERVAQKAHEIFMKETRNPNHTECDETRCMQNIAEAFQAELIATANVTKQDGNYFLALSIQNIFDNKVVYSESLPCKNCDATQVVDKLKELSGTIVPFALPSEGKVATKDSQKIVSENDKSSDAKFKRAEKYFKGDVADEDFEKAIKLLKPLATQGNAKAQNALGTMYEKGQGVVKNLDAALKWYRKAAVQGVAEAQTNLGEMYESGRGIDQDREKARSLYMKAAEQGYARAQYMIGAYFMMSVQDGQKAEEWFKKAADQGYAPAQSGLGMLYEGYDNFPKDKAKALEWYKKAADQGDESAQKTLRYLQ